MSKHPFSDYEYITWKRRIHTPDAVAFVDAAIIYSLLRHAMLAFMLAAAIAAAAAVYADAAAAAFAADATLTALRAAFAVTPFCYAADTLLMPLMLLPLFDAFFVAARYAALAADAAAIFAAASCLRYAMLHAYYDDFSLSRHCR